MTNTLLAFLYPHPADYRHIHAEFTMKYYYSVQPLILLSDVIVLRPVRYKDSRGFFTESFNEREFAKEVNNGIPIRFVQDNHSHSMPRVVRGLHFQANNPQGKLIRVAKGVILDVVVDIRPESPTFGMWDSYVLSATMGEQLWIPPGFAHGFCTHDLPTDVLYKVTDYRHPEDECCIRYDDPFLKINWETSPRWKMNVSDKDQRGMSWEDFKKKSNGG